MNRRTTTTDVRALFGDGNADAQGRAGSTEPPACNDSTTVEDMLALFVPDGPIYVMQMTRAGTLWGYSFEDTDTMSAYWTACLEADDAVELEWRDKMTHAECVEALTAAYRGDAQWPLTRPTSC